MMRIEPRLGELQIDCRVDTDNAGKQDTRKSVGCTVLRLNGALLHYYSRQQTVVGTSSAEAEYYGIGGGSCGDSWAAECAGRA